MLVKVALLGIAVGFVALGPLSQRDALAQSIPSPSPSPRATSTPTPAPKPTTLPTKKPSRLHIGIDSYTSGTNQQFVGPGVNGAAEIPNFQAGGPLAPTVPYDFFSGAPTTTGQAISQDLLVSPTYRLQKFDVAVTFGYGSIGGSGNVGAYWGDALMPTINPHLGSRAFTVGPDFPTHNGGDPVNASRLSVLNGTIAFHDGSGALTGGWFDQHQSVPFVFSQAPQTNAPFQLSPEIPQSIGDGTPSVDVFRGESGLLPLQGYDLWGKTNSFSFEILNANLPALAGNVARASSISGVYSAGQVKISAEVAHLMESGPITGRFSFGSGLTGGLDGAAIVPQSTVDGQRMDIEGIGAVFPVATADAELRYGHSCYAADNVAIPTSSCTAGNYYYAKFHQGFTKFDVGLEFVRFEPQYAPAVLSYGTIENVWSSPLAFPGTWLNGTYQFVNNSEVGSNRQGVRASTTFLIAGVEARFAVARYEQVSPYDLTSGAQAGFIEPYFSPQLTATNGVRGTETHASGWFAWHPKLVDVTLEVSDVVTNRNAPAGRPQDAIAIDYPAAVLSLSRTFGRWLGGVGAGRYAVEGSWDTVGTINASLSQNVVFAGLQLRANANSAYGLEYSIFSVNGVPLVPAGLSPAYHGPQIQFYQRLKT